MGFDSAFKGLNWGGGQRRDGSGLVDTLLFLIRMCFVVECRLSCFKEDAFLQFNVTQGGRELCEFFCKTGGGGC
jgi:hypothetical protein